jgi:hypothetical protein
MAITFGKDIAPLFVPSDIASMKSAPNGFDLSSYIDVCTWSAEILNQLQLGNMPCDGAWSDANVSLFAQWITNGKLP